jgi:hypothetical protein
MRAMAREEVFPAISHLESYDLQCEEAFTGDMATMKAAAASFFCPPS